MVKYARMPNHHTGTNRIIYPDMALGFVILQKNMLKNSIMMSLSMMDLHSRISLYQLLMGDGLDEQKSQRKNLNLLHD